MNSISLSRQKIAVVGGGIAGLTAAHYLSRRHDVQLFEAAPRLGGHSCTVEVVEDGQELMIDMGFIVFNDWTYPNFIRLLGELGIESEPSSMSFSVRCEQTGLEYNGSSLGQLFAQRRNLLRFEFYRMLAGILRFHRVAPRALRAADDPSLGAFLERERLRGPFREQYLVPMIAAIWSTEPARMLKFPARTLVAFLDNHGLLSVDRRPQWRVIRGGSRAYVDEMARRLGERARTATPIEWIRRHSDGVEIKPRDAAVERFDQVVLATHSDQALALLSDPSPVESEILGAIPYRDNDVVLHTDEAFLPRRRRAWASWNYHLNPPQPGGAQVTYHMNSLQNLETRRQYLVTLNRIAEIAPEKILAKRVFAHPLYTREGLAAQRRWAEINGPRRTWYCGAWWSWGFHEDGVKSGLRVARALGVEMEQL